MTRLHFCPSFVGAGIIASRRTAARPMIIEKALQGKVDYKIGPKEDETSFEISNNTDQMGDSEIGWFLQVFELLNEGRRGLVTA
jgi:hypothetical protein